MENKVALLKLSGKNIIPTCEVIYMQSDGNYTVIHTVNRCKHISVFTLKTWEERTRGDTFLRINKGLLINRQFIVKVDAIKKEKFLYLATGLILPISRRKYQESKTYFNKISN